MEVRRGRRSPARNHAAEKRIDDNRHRCLYFLALEKIPLWRHTTTKRQILLVQLVAISGFTTLVATCAFAAPNTGQSAGPEPQSRASAIYRANCAACHGSRLEGGQFAPSLKGPAFVAKWFSRNPSTLQRFIETSMPPASPGKLGWESNEQLARYIMAVNHESPASIHKPSGKTRQDAQGISRESGNTQLGVTAAAESSFHDDIFRFVEQSRSGRLSQLTPISDDDLAAPPPQDWLTWRGGRSLLSFSPLAEIDTTNVSALAVAWAWSLPTGPNEIEPLVHDGVLFVASNNHIQALNAVTGDLLWDYAREIPPQYQGSVSAIHRNMAIYGGNLYAGTNDRHIVALDMKTGHVVWDQSVAPVAQPATVLSSGPIAVRGKLIQGLSGGPACLGGCSIVAFDASSGRELWRFNTIAHPGDPGGNSWNSLPTDKRSGGGVWSAGSFDPKTGLVFFGIGQTYKVAPLLTKTVDAGETQEALYTDSTVALDPDSGRLVWFHQHFPRDVWDLDEAFERSLIPLNSGGALKDAIVEVGKSGILDALDPRTGAHLFSIDFGFQNFLDVNPKSGVRKPKPEFIPTAGVSEQICPSIWGVKNWMTSAYDPRAGIMYFPLLDTCMDYTWHPNANETPFDIGWRLTPGKSSNGNFGRLLAVDVVNRKTLWTKESRSPFSSSLLATAGGVVFVGSRDRVFQAIDSKSGKTLWATTLNGAPSSSPITFAAGGVQYIAVVAGGGGPHDSGTGEITPEIKDSTAATTIWVFRLPPKISHK